MPPKAQQRSPGKLRRQDFRRLLNRRPLLLDGATATELQRQGMPAGCCVEKWVLDNPSALLDLQRSYIKLGCDIILACTFGANPFKLEAYGLAQQTEEINRELARLSRQALGKNALLFGDLAPSGRFVEPFGDLPFEEAVAGFREQVRGLYAGGVQGFMIETMMDLQEARAALLAVREICDLPVLVSMTYGPGSRTLTGTDPASAVVALQALGADSVGCNCSTGPEDMVPILQAMLPFARVPLLAKPNAGMPRASADGVDFAMSPQRFGEMAATLVQAGARLIGGCCGAGPAHMAEAAKAIKRCRPPLKMPAPQAAVCSARKTVVIAGEQPLLIVGERINPTGKKHLQAELRDGKFDLVRRYALEQAQQGAALLDINFGLPGIDEAAAMRQAVLLLSQLVETPLCLDTSDPKALEAGLRIYPGRALVNSISAEKRKLRDLLPIAGRYGAMIIALPVSDRGVPKTAAERSRQIAAIAKQTKRVGLRREDLVVDGVVMAASAEPGAARETLATVAWASKHGYATILGVSNVSFGLPERKWPNAALLAMAAGEGLSMAIANPGAEMVMELRAACDALLGKDPGLRAYLRRFGASAAAAQPETAPAALPLARLARCIIEGNEADAAAAADAALAAGIAAQTAIDECLIPAIKRVGEMFDRREYFLPQLMLAARTMEIAFSRLAPHLGGEGAKSTLPGGGQTVILATVKGDIHDIGKNLVGLLLRNYGFNVVDLGKDVAAEKIVAAAQEHRAALIGLSALMTTTMQEMRHVISLARESSVNCRFMVGGAVVDEAFAREIGADGYAPDAVSAVRLAVK
ncbi:MAG: homocysteine S-methyltransferase family protein, partial [Planctomycetota bacterium]|nr:homocysteine S-methyltransferase family protein [Planctomycetota bacterium]